MAIIKLPYRFAQASCDDRFEKAKNSLKKIIQHQFKHSGFGVYAKYDVGRDLIILWLAKPAETSQLIATTIDSSFKTEGEKGGFEIDSNEFKPHFFSDKELEALTKYWPIQIRGPLSQNDMSDCFDRVDKRFEEFELEAQNNQETKLK